MTVVRTRVSSTAVTVVGGISPVRLASESSATKGTSTTDSERCLSKNGKTLRLHG